MNKKIRSLNSSCLCNGISLKIKGEFRPVINCHCIQCAKTHGNYAAYTSVLEENIVFKSKKTLKWYKSSTKAKRGFCNNCGASIFFKRSESISELSRDAVPTRTGLPFSLYISISWTTALYFSFSVR